MSPQLRSDLRLVAPETQGPKVTVISGILYDMQTELDR